MSSKVEDRIVSLRFNNSDFLKKVAETNRTLGELEKGLNLQGGGKGIAVLQSIGGAVDNISSKFSAFGAVAFTVIQNVVNAAIGVGQQMAASILDPLVEGGKKRALAIEQAKFQFKGLGMDVERTMEAALYAVKGTAFGLDEAASAAASLGASQVPLEKMGDVLRGISGVAALTGSSYSDIADVFTKVAGQGRLMADDLNRLSSRGMNAAATLAQAMGISESEVRELVSKGKISFQEFADVMNNTFGEQATKASDTFTGALSNMRAALARIGAAFAAVNFEGLRKIFNALTPAIDNIKTALTPIIDEFTSLSAFRAENLANILGVLNTVPEGGGLPDFFVGLQNVSEALLRVWGPLRDAFLDIFPPATGDKVQSMAAAFKSFTEGLKLSDSAMAGLKSTFRGVFAAFDIVGIVIGEVIGLFGRLLGATNVSAGGILNFTGGIGEFIVSVRDAMRNGEGFKNFFKGLEGVLRNVGVGFMAVIDWFKRAGAAIVDFIDIPGWGNLWTGFIDGMKTFLDWLGNLGGEVGGASDDVGAKIKEFFANFDFSVLVGLLNVGAIGALILFIQNFVRNFGKMLGNLLGSAGGGIVDTIKDAFGTLTDTMEAMQGRLKAETLIRIAIAIGILAASVLALSFIDPARLSSSLAAMTVMFIQLSAALVVLDKFVTPDKLAKLPMLAATLIILATAMVIFAAAITIMSRLTWEELGKGMAAMAVGLGLLVNALYGVQALKIERMGSTAIALTLMASALVVMAAAFKIFQTLSWEDIARGLSGMVGTMSILIAVSRLSQSSAQGAAAMFIISAALNVLGAALHVMAALNWDELGRALLTLAGSLLVMAIGVQAMKGSVGGAAAMLIVSAGVLVLSQALQQLAKMSWDDIGRALVVMAGGLAILAGAMALMGLPITLLGAAGMIVAATAMNMLAPALYLLGTMSWDDIGRGLAVLASALAIIAVGGVLLIAALPGLLGLGLATLMIGTGAIMASVGLTALALALTAIVAVANLGAQAVTDTLITIVGIIPKAMAAFAQGIIDFALVIANGGTEITKAVSTLINSIVTAIAENGPLIIDTFHNLLMQMLNKVEESAPRIIEVAHNLIIQFGNSMSELLPFIVEVGMNILVSVINGIAQRVGEVVMAATNVVIMFITGIGNGLGRIIEAGVNVVINFVNGVANSIRSNQGRMEEAGWNLASAIVSGMVNGIAGGIGRVINAARNLAQNAISAAMNALDAHSPSREFVKVGGYAPAGMAIGMLNGVSQVKKAGEKMGEAALYSTQKSIAKIASDVATQMDFVPVVRPVVDLSGVKAGAREANDLFLPYQGPRLTLDRNYAAAEELLTAYDNTQEAREEDNARREPGREGFTFIQNNSSPKALSNTEIYRKSKNIISVAKKVINAPSN